MDPERWNKVTGIFHAALAQDHARRQAFLDDACDGDTALRREVDALLAGDARAGDNPDPLRPASGGIAPGTQLGPYRIESLIGAGGMGEVYKARDTRLNRSVAIKVMPATFAGDPDLRQRFEREAQAIAALHHPHICVLHDIGRQDGFEFLVMEHLIGETLQDRLAKGPLPLDLVLRYAIEVADALHSAHRAGILHRDLKPGNIMLTKDGAKLLDFGLAKFTGGARVFGGATAMPTTPRTLTTDGAIVGTFQYMAPEQVEGREADERTDLFAFGAVLYEMTTGRTAFSGESRSSLIAAILRDDPAPLTASVPSVPPALDLVVRACLVKDPDARLQSARDAALQLRWIQSGVLAAPGAVAIPPASRAIAWAAAVLVLAALTAAGAYAWGRRSVRPSELQLKQLTFRRGFVENALFTPDGETVVYTAAWDGAPQQPFSMRIDSGEAQPLPVPPGFVMSVSRNSELALLTKFGTDSPTLAQVPLGGGGVRQLVDHVQWADWMPDGRSLAVLRSLRQGQTTLEFPLGTVVHEWSAPNTPIPFLRVSPDGSRVALIEGDSRGGGWLTVVDRGGKATRLSRQWAGVNTGITWAPGGDEIWYNASEVGLNFQVHGVAADGRERLVHQSMGSVRVQDAAANGRVLIVHDRSRRTIVGLAPGEQRERDLSWLDFGGIMSLSADGRLLSFTESGVGAGPHPVGFLRGTDGSPAVRFGEGTAGPLSPDGKTMLFLEDRAGSLKLVPVGAGEPRKLDLGSLTFITGFSAWVPDGTRVVFGANEPGASRRLWVLPIAGGSPRAITPAGAGWGASSMVVSPDSRSVLAMVKGKPWIYPIDAGEPRPLPGVAAGELPLRWAADGRSIWLLGAERSPARVYQLDVATGRRTLWREIAETDPAGLEPNFFKLAISADGKSYVRGYLRTLSDLYLGGGIK